MKHVNTVWQNKPPKEQLLVIQVTLNFYEYGLRCFNCIAKAETCRFKEPKLIQDPCPTSIDYDDSWDIPSNQPCFRPELLRENASTMV